jgi:hypothetical protein
MSISVAAVVATLHVAAVILRHRRCYSCRSSSSHDLSVYKVHFERRLVSLGGLLIIPQCRATVGQFDVEGYQGIATLIFINGIPLLFLVLSLEQADVRLRQLERHLKFPSGRLRLRATHEKSSGIGTHG